MRTTLIRTDHVADKSTQPMRWKALRLIVGVGLESSGRAAPWNTKHPCSAHRMSLWQEVKKTLSDEKEKRTPWVDQIVAEVRSARAALLASILRGSRSVCAKNK